MQRFLPNLADFIAGRRQKPYAQLEGPTIEVHSGIESFSCPSHVLKYPTSITPEVLKGITFKITAGQSVGLVGPSGGGGPTEVAGAGWLVKAASQGGSHHGAWCRKGDGKNALKMFAIRWENHGSPWTFNLFVGSG